MVSLNTHGSDTGDWPLSDFPFFLANITNLKDYQKFFELSRRIVTGPELTSSTSMTA
jgi:hypothetical protein